MNGLRAEKVQLNKLQVGATKMISEIIEEALTITCNYLSQNYSKENYRILFNEILNMTSTLAFAFKSSEF